MSAQNPRLFERHDFRADGVACSTLETEITLRDIFAGLFASQAINVPRALGPDEVAVRAYRQADAMLARRAADVARDAGDETEAL